MLHNLCYKGWKSFQNFQRQFIFFINFLDYQNLKSQIPKGISKPYIPNTI